MAAASQVGAGMFPVASTVPVNLKARPSAGSAAWEAWWRFEGQGRHDMVISKITGQHQGLGCDQRPLSWFSGQYWFTRRRTAAPFRRHRIPLWFSSKPMPFRLVPDSGKIRFLSNPCGQLLRRDSISVSHFLLCGEFPLLSHGLLCLV